MNYENRHFKKQCIHFAWHKIQPSGSKLTNMPRNQNRFLLLYFNINLIHFYPQVLHFAFHLDNTQDFLALARLVILAEGQAEHLLIWLVI